MARVTSLKSKTPRITPRQVVSVERSDMFNQRSFERWNPDALAQRKGGLGIYARMMYDEQVKAVLRFKQLSIIGRGYQFAFDETELAEEEQAARVSVMEAMTRRMSGSFTDTLLATLRAYLFGYSIQEIITDTITVSGSTYVGINKILSRDVAAFQFYTDEYGELQRFTQKSGSKESDLDYNKFLHYVQNPEEDAYYGQSELRAAYRAWFMKDTSIKFWMQYLERVAGGFAAITQTNDSSLVTDSEDYNEIKSILNNLRGTMGVILPRGLEIDLVSPTSTDAYQKAVEFHDLAIAKSLLIPNLLGLSNSGQTGAYAQSQTQLEVYFMTISADAARLEQCVNDQLFGPIAAQNWDDGEYPRFRFKTASADQVKWIAETFQKMVGANMIVCTEADEAYFRKLLDVPVRDEGDLPLVTPQQQNDNAIAAKALEQKTQAVPIDADQSTTLKKEPTGDGDGKSFTEDRVAELIAEVTEKLREELKPAIETKPAKTFTAKQRAEQRVDFAVIAQRTRVLEDDTSRTVAVLVARAVRRQLSDERLKELLDADTQDIGELKMDSADVGKIKSAFRSALERGWSMGINQAMDETGKARKQAYADAVRTVRFADLRGKASEYFDANSFRMAGNLTDGMRSIIQQELLSAVRSGVRPEQAAAKIYERLIRKGMTTLDAIQLEEPRAEVRKLAEELLGDALDVANVPAYINTLTRTNTFEALNEARYAEFTAPEMDGFVEALQFSSVLDDRTTEICTAMDGHTHAVGSPVWDTYRPPLHFGCRSVLIAVTTLDGWDGVEDAHPTVEPQDGF